MPQWALYVNFGLICCGGGSALVLSSISRRRQKRNQYDEVRQEHYQQQLIETCPTEISQVADYALRADAGLMTALTALMSSMETGEGEEDDLLSEDLSWCEDSPQEVILHDLCQAAALLRPERTDVHLHLLQQFGLTTQIAHIADVDVDLRDWREFQVGSETPDFRALSLLAKMAHPDRQILRDLYLSCLRLCSGDDSTHLAFAAEEIRLAALTDEEARAEVSSCRWDHELRRARYMIDIYARHGGRPKVLAALAGYADRKSSGLAEVLLRPYRAAPTAAPKNLLVICILSDLFCIVGALSRDLYAPTPDQMRLIRDFGHLTYLSSLFSIDDTVMQDLAEIGLQADLLALKELSETNHRDRFLLRELYIEFARSASRHCEELLPIVEQYIQRFVPEPGEPSCWEEDSGARGTASSPREILGLTEAVSAEEIKRAYHRQVQLWHPDRLSGMAPELQALANERLAQVNEAYSTLRADMA